MASKCINNSTPKNLEVVCEQNHVLVASIKNSFWYRVTYSVFCIQVNKLISYQKPVETDLSDSMYKNAIIQNLLNLNWFGSGTFRHTSFFTGQTSLPLVTITLILTTICGSHLTLYYHLTYFPRSCAQLMNGVQVNRWQYHFNKMHKCLTIKKNLTRWKEWLATRQRDLTSELQESPLQCQVSLCPPHSRYFSNLCNRAAEHPHLMRLATMMKQCSWQFLLPISPLSHK